MSSYSNADRLVDAALMLSFGITLIACAVAVWYRYECHVLRGRLREHKRLARRYGVDVSQWQ